MSPEKQIVAAKTCALVGFLTLIVISYWLRSEALGLSRIHFSADEKKMEFEGERTKASFPERQKQYEVSLKNHDLEVKHYEKLMEVYQRDLEAYAELTKNQLHPPLLPQHPDPPRSPEVEDQFRSIQAQFVQRKYRFFVISEYGNWGACLGALLLAGGLMYLLMFDVNSNRLYYFLALVFSFVFLIGPALQSVITTFIGLMHGPSLY